MKHNRQRGGTLLGIVIGLVLGLGIALAVAMVITKTPIPFIDKSGRQKAFEPAADKMVDPNRPMYNKRATPPAEIAPPPNTAAPQPVVKPGSVADLPAADAAPIVDKPVAGSAGAASAQDEEWAYYLQAGAFRELHDAESMRAKLALLGIEARVSERQSETGVLFRVRAGPFDQLETMNRMRQKLSDNSIDAAVVRISR